MVGLADFYLNHPFWAWAAVGAGLLAIEVAVGSGYLLWATGAAAAVAVFAATRLSPGLPAELGLFAVLTIAGALVSRKFFPPRPQNGLDINDAGHRLVGLKGAAVGAFHGGYGRVFVDGKEWAAEYADGDAPADGDRVEVVAVIDGGALRVRRV